MSSETLEMKTVGIIGGGKVGLQLFELFRQSSIARVAYVVDVNRTAPAVMAAQKMGVRTLTDLEIALDTPVDLIFEVTGSAKVAEAITARIDRVTGGVITHEMAQIVLQVIEENNQKVKTASVTEIQEIQNEITSHLVRLGGLIEDIEGILSQMNMLAINARIEAARVGEQGKGFAVVASEMARSSAAVKTITDEIKQINEAIGKTSTRIDASLERLK